MSSRNHNYIKRSHSTAYNDELCFSLRFQLDSYVDDKDFKTIKIQIFSKTSSQEQISLRSLHRMYKSYLINETTKKKSGQSSRYIEFDEEIFEFLIFIDLEGLALKKYAKQIAINIIKKSDPKFKCSDIYLRRLIVRYELRRGFEELPKQICRPMEVIEKNDELFILENQSTTLQYNQPQRPLEEDQVEGELERNPFVEFFSEAPHEEDYRLLERYNEDLPFKNNSQINFQYQNIDENVLYDELLEENHSLFYNTINEHVAFAEFHEESVFTLKLFGSEEEEKYY